MATLPLCKNSMIDADTLDRYGDRQLPAWKAPARLDLENTVSVLVEASQQVGGTEHLPTLLSHSGVENVNGRVDELVDVGCLQRVLALAEIAYSLIEAWWRSLKHQWLFLNRLDGIATVRKLVAFYVSPSTTHGFRTRRFVARLRTKCTSVWATSCLGRSG